jgi:hypothetical protein
MKVYKGVTERDRFFLGGYDAEKMEEVLMPIVERDA